MATYSNNRRYGNRKRTHYHKPQQNTQPKLGVPMVSMPESFAKAMLKQILYNPRNATGAKTTSYSLQDKDDILSWLQSPSSNEKSLRDASN